MGLLTGDWKFGGGTEVAALTAAPLPTNFQSRGEPHLQALALHHSSGPPDKLSAIERTGF